MNYSKMKQVYVDAIILIFFPLATKLQVYPMLLQHFNNNVIILPRQAKNQRFMLMKAIIYEISMCEQYTVFGFTGIYPRKAVGLE